MDQREALNVIEASFERVRDANAAGALLRSASPADRFCPSHQDGKWARVREILEGLATGSAVWWLRRRIEQYRFRKCLEKNDELSFETKRQCERWLNADLACRYGYVPGPALRSTIARYHQTGMSQRDLRLLIVNRILRRDGTVRISPFKENVLYGFGWVFVGFCVIKFAGVMALVWASPAGLFFKFLAITVSVTIYLGCGYLVSCYNIIPYPVIRNLLRGK